MTTPPSLLPDIAGAGLVAPQEARVQHAHRLACVRPRGLRCADELSVSRVRGDPRRPYLVGKRICRAWRLEPAEPRWAFSLQLQGQFGTFLYTDPDDSTVTGQGIGIGDGIDDGPSPSPAPSADLPSRSAG